MARNYYSEINLHIVWHTKENIPLLTSQIEPFVHDYLRSRLIKTPGVFVHEIGGTVDHVHLCISIPPTVLICELVGQLKGASVHEANQQFGAVNKILQWQAGYGVVSFGTQHLEWVKRYVRDQKQHHGQGTMQPRLEQSYAVEDSAE